MFRPKRFFSAKMQLNLEFPAFFAKVKRFIQNSPPTTPYSASPAVKFVGLPALLAIFAVLSGPAACANEMGFSIVTIGSSMQCGGNCPSVIAANGEITNNTPAAFVDFLQRNALQTRLHAIVLLDSPGGKVVASMELGKILRRLGAAVVVARAGGESSNGALLAGRCFSACVYAFIGGKKRVIPPQSAAGIHRMFTYDYGVDPSGLVGERHQHFDDGGMASILSRYTGRMGVNPQIIAAAEHITPEQIHIVSRAEMARWHLAATRF
jgi:hypothetical protein